MVPDTSDTTYTALAARESIIVGCGETLNIDIGSNATANKRRIVRLNGYLIRG